MFVSQKLRKENVAEFLLYMWQVEDVLRAYTLDVDRLAEGYLSQFQYDASQKQQVQQWYEDLAEMMRSEGVAESGHLQINKNIVILLNDLHAELLRSTKHPFYSAAYYKALPFIVELRQRSNTQDKTEIENCFDAMYGLMLLRLQGKPVSEETTKAMNHISQFLALLAEYERKERAGELEF
ncbi:MAG: DUF4924 family protein [Prevotellaceae bacterium]|nr:DUF4924 family protein [Prevotellaceae bacterium]